MGRRPLILAASLLAVAGGLAACGSDEEDFSSEDLDPPALTIPTDHSAEEAAKDSRTGTDTDETTTDETTATTEESTSAAPAQPAAPAATTPQNTGGQAAPGATTQQQTTQTPAGGTPAQQFEEFCAQNPGAC